MLPRLICSIVIMERRVSDKSPYETSAASASPEPMSDLNWKNASVVEFISL